MRYLEAQHCKALSFYIETRSVAKTIRRLGFQTSGAGFYKWIKKSQDPVQEVKRPTPETKLSRGMPLLHSCG